MKLCFFKKNLQEVGVLKEMVKTIMKAYPDFTYQEEERYQTKIAIDEYNNVQFLNF